MFELNYLLFMKTIVINIKKMFKFWETSVQEGPNYIWVALPQELKLPKNPLPLIFRAKQCQSHFSS